MKTKPYPKYKPSGVEWLGDVPEHWGVKRLKNCLSLITNKNETSSGFQIALENIESWTGRYINSDTQFEGEGVQFEAGDILFGKLRPYLAKVYLAEKKGESVGDIFVLRPKEGLMSEFVSKVLLSRKYIDIIDGSTYGSKMPRASWDFMGNLLLFVPPLFEQQAIADFLDRETGRIDALIAKKERLLKLLAEQRAALISRAVSRGLDKAVKLKPSGVEWLGDIPGHWEEKKVKALLRALKGAIKTGPFGSQILSSEMEGEDIKVYNQKNVILKDFALGENYISLEKYKELMEFTVFPGDFLITTRGTIGRCAIVPRNAEVGILHPCLMRLQINKRQVVERFLEILIADSEIIFEQLNIKSNNTTIDVIYQETLKNVVVFLPPFSEQYAIADFLDRETAKIDALFGKVKEAIEKLREYHSALISAAVTGKIDVREAYEFV